MLFFLNQKWIRIFDTLAVHKFTRISSFGIAVNKKCYKLFNNIDCVITIPTSKSKIITDNENNLLKKKYLYTRSTG